MLSQYLIVGDLPDPVIYLAAIGVFTPASSCTRTLHRGSDREPAGST